MATAVAVAYAQASTQQAAANSTPQGSPGTAPASAMPHVPPTPQAEHSPQPKTGTSHNTQSNVATISASQSVAAPITVNPDKSSDLQAEMSQQARPGTTHDVPSNAAKASTQQPVAVPKSLNPTQASDSQAQQLQPPCSGVTPGMSSSPGSAALPAAAPTHNPLSEPTQCSGSGIATGSAAGLDAAPTAPGVADESGLNIAAALKAVCQLATNALEVVPVFIEQLAGSCSSTGEAGLPLAVYK